MALSYSNLIGGQSTPATTALRNKINPQPLQPLVGSLAPKPFLPNNNPNPNITNDGTALVSNTSGQNTPSKTSTTSITPVDLHKPLITLIGTQGGTHTSTDAAGNSISTKVNPSATSNTSNNSTTSTTPVIASPTSTTLTQDQQTASNQGKPGYDQLGNPLTTNPTPTPVTTPTPNQITYNGLIGGVVGAANNTEAEQNATAAKIANLKTNLQTDIGGVQGQPELKSYGMGRIGLLQNQEAAQESAAQGELQSEIAAGTQKIGALQGAASSVAPQAGASYFGNPLTGGLVGNGTAGTGASTNILLGDSATGNTLVDNSVENALTEIQNGSTTTSDAMANLVGGDVARTAFTNAMLKYDPNWSPTASNTIASANMAQGAQYQAQAQNISNALQTMTPVTQQLTSFMTSAGLDPAQYPLLNKQINTINAQTNPDAVATMNSAIGEIKSFASQLLASQAGGTPTGVQSALDSYDFSNFTPVQLHTFLDNLNELGQIRLSQTQSAMKAGYGKQTTTTPAAGANANPSGGLDTGGMVPATNAANMLKIVGGAGANVLASALDDLSRQTGSAVAGIVAGATTANATKGAAAAAGLI